MTLFGLLLRGVMPSIADPEAGLSIFFETNINAVATGIIVADVFATIAATSNGLLIAMAQSILYDLVPPLSGGRRVLLPLGATTLIVGLITMAVSAIIQGSVVSLALSSVSLMGAGLAAAVMIKVLNWRHTASSLLLAIAAGISSAVFWKYLGYGSTFNEAGTGILVALSVNYIVARLHGPVVSTRRRASS